MIEAAPTLGMMAAHHCMIRHILSYEPSSNGLPGCKRTEALEDKAMLLHPVEYTMRNDADSSRTNRTKKI